jgi:biopolymer transport protein ExbD
MVSGKPNNLPWIILGIVGAAAMLALFGFGFYSGAQSVRSEMGLTFPDVAKATSSVEAKNKVIITVDSDNRIFLDGKPIEDVPVLKNTLDLLDSDSVKSKTFVLRISEDSSHIRLIDVKDMLDDLEVSSMIEIIRSDVE